MDTRCGGLAVRRPLQPRDKNVAAAPSTVVIGKVQKPKPRARATGRQAPPPPPPAAAAEELSTRAQYREETLGVAEVSLAEELEKARERRGRLRAARELTEREMDGRAAALDWEAAEWKRRAEEQRRLVAELMRLIGVPEAYTPVESLRCKEEERKRREAVVLAHSGSTDSTSAASLLQGDSEANSCVQESRQVCQLQKW